MGTTNTPTPTPGSGSEDQQNWVAGGGLSWREDDALRRLRT